MAFLAKGTRLYADPAGGTNYAELANLKEITDGFTAKVKVVDVTPLTPTTSETEVQPGLGEKGTLAFKQFWTKDREATLAAPYAARTSVGWKRTFPDNANPLLATKDVFTGFITNLHTEGTGSADDPIMIVCEVQVDSAVVRTNGS